MIGLMSLLDHGTLFCIRLGPEGSDKEEVEAAEDEEEEARAEEREEEERGGRSKSSRIRKTRLKPKAMQR